MAGANKKLKAGEVLFRSGDPSDGMYIVRQGELEVFLEEGGKQVSLAKVNSGAMIGEMALFDRKPRSASVKAVQDTEVTQITNDDFGKLMKQIPKWFVSLMATLSTRLRTTNERLQKLESTTKGGPAFSRVTRTLQMLNLIMQTKGVKDKRCWVLTRGETIDMLKQVLPELAPEIEKIVHDLTQAGLFELSKDAYNNPAIGLRNKGDIDRVLALLDAWLKTNGGVCQYPAKSLVQMLQTFQNLLAQAVYDTASISLDDMQLEGKKQKLDTAAWRNHVDLLKLPDAPVKVVKTESGGVGLRGDKKEVVVFIQFISVISALGEKGLA